ncbi:TrbL/VirB6 family protein [Helicobacter trogontum]|uniref:Type IV secretion system protein n=1 Tax=Helicobacter trogontum TaxID=50960 RepID=A0A4U8S3L4_9HELI|nr:type IV secretion system protein [Helicobacter trogontum]TLD80360.1 type IV secretion system protein [Helicobacter trogontum]
MSESVVFQNLGESIQSVLDVMKQASMSPQVSQLMTLISMSITIMIMIKGYAILAGKTQNPLRELLWDMTIKAIIICFCLNLNNWLTLVIDALNGIYEWAGGGTTLYVKLDDMFAKVLDLNAQIWQMQSGLLGEDGAIVGVISSLLVFLGFGVGAVSTLIVLVITSFSQTLLVALAPLMFFCLFYGFLRNTFNQWINLLLNNTLTILLVSMFFNSVLSELQTKIIALTAKAEHNLLLVGMQILLAGLLLGVLSGIASKIAQQLAQVSLENVMSSGATQMATMAGGATGFILGKTMNAAPVNIAKGAAGFMANKALHYASKKAFGGAKDLLKKARNE